jgi:ADP-ribose pyrophosphatase
MRLDKNSWQVNGRKQIVEIKPWLTLWREEVQLPDGRVVDDYYALDMPDFVVVTAFTGEGKVIAEGYYRHGIRQVALTLPTGIIDAHEKPIEAAKRELWEEIGYAGGKWHALGKFVLSGTCGGGYAHLFLVVDVEKRAAPPGGDLEDIEVVLTSLIEFRKAIQEGKIQEVCVVSAFMLAHARVSEIS